MDKRTFTTRMKPTASDLNYVVNDSEQNDWYTTKEQLFDEDTVQTGLLATGDNSNVVTISAGRAFEGSTGKRISVPTGVTLTWDGTNGQVANLTTNRKDLVSIKHAYLDGVVQPRQFIDVDPTSSTYGQAYTSNVVTNKTDYYTFYVTSGTGESVGTPLNVPQCPSGTIPLFTVNIISGTATHINSNHINNTIFNNIRSDVGPTNGGSYIKTLRDVTKMISYDSDWVEITTNPQDIGTADKNLQPVVSLTIKDIATSVYSSENTTTTSATYNPSTGTVSVVGGSGSTKARVILWNYIS